MAGGLLVADESLSTGLATYRQEVYRGPAMHGGVPEGSRKVTSPSSRSSPGANTQGASLDEARRNLREAVALMVEANRTLAREDDPGDAVIREPFSVTA